MAASPACWRNARPRTRSDCSTCWPNAAAGSAAIPARCCCAFSAGMVLSPQRTLSPACAMPGSISPKKPNRRRTLPRCKGSSMPGPGRRGCPISTSRASARCQQARITKRGKSCLAKEAGSDANVVMPGLDPGIHHASQEHFWKWMDHRVKPGDDNLLRHHRRLLVMPLRQGKNLDAGRGPPDRMLELRRQPAVARHRGPAVRQDLHMRLAEVDHRLDGEEHAGLEQHALAGPADMNDVGLVVEHPSQTMAAEIAHHAHALRLDETLDRMADVASGGAGLHRGDAAHHRF